MAKEKKQWSAFKPVRKKTALGVLEVRLQRMSDAKRANEVFTNPTVNRFLLVPANGAGGSLAATKKHIHSYLSNPSKRPFVVTLDGDPVGFANLDRRTGRSSHVASYGIMVDPRVHGKGVAKFLLATLFAFAKRSGITRISATVHADNPRARAFYKKMGLKEDGVAKNELRVNGRYADSIYIGRML